MMKKPFYLVILAAAAIPNAFQGMSSRTFFGIPETTAAAASCPGGRCALAPSFSSPNSFSAIQAAGTRPAAETSPAMNYRAEYASPHPAVVRILVENAQTRNLGTGTWVQISEGRCAVLTCAHLFETDTPDRVAVNFPDQPAFSARIQAIDRKWDVALLQAAAGLPPTLPKPVILRTSAPIQGEYLRMCGLGPDGRSLWVLGTALGYCRIKSAESINSGGINGNDGMRNDGAHTLVVTGNARQGDSGAPLFALDGTLAAVLWGTDGAYIYGTWCGQIRTIFETAFREKIPVPPASNQAESFPKNAPKDGNEYRTANIPGSSAGNYAGNYAENYAENSTERFRESSAEVYDGNRSGNYAGVYVENRTGSAGEYASEFPAGFQEPPRRGILPPFRPKEGKRLKSPPKFRPRRFHVPEEYESEYGIPYPWRRTEENPDAKPVTEKNSAENRNADVTSDRSADASPAQEKAKRFPMIPFRSRTPLLPRDSGTRLLPIRFPYGLMTLYLAAWLAPIAVMYVVYRRKMHTR